MDDVPWCPRCGRNIGPAPELPCSNCWEGRAGPDDVRRLVLAVEAGTPRAAGLLRAVRDPAAAPWFRTQLDHPHPRVRAAAVCCLGRAGDDGDVLRIAQRLDDEDTWVRADAQTALTRLGGAAAADAMAAQMERERGDERLSAALMLASMGDGRAAGPLRDFFGAGPDDWRAAGIPTALLDVGGAADRRAVVEAAMALLRTGEEYGARRAISHVMPVLAAFPDEFAAERAELAGRGLLPEPTQDVERTFRRSRPVPRRTMTGFTDEPSLAKFGGQPIWIDIPAWPVTGAGRALTFYGEMPLSRDGSQVAYVFLNLDDRVETFGWLEEGNAVVIQPGNRCHLVTVPVAEGPRLFSDSAAYERFVTLEEGADPEAWELGDPQEHGDWNKIGGTPLHLQGEPPPDWAWTFAFEFSASWAWQDLADGAQCYVYIRDDGLGIFYWDCH